MGLKWYLQRELHGDTGRGASAEVRVVLDAKTVTLVGFGALDGTWTVGATQEPSVRARESGWGVALEREGRALLLTMSTRPLVATLESDEATQAVPLMRAPVPEWLIGRWIVDATRLSSAEKARLGEGWVEIQVRSLSYGGFAAVSQIFERSWPAPQVRTTGAKLRLDCFDYDEAWLVVKERHGERVLVDLGGMEGLPWSHELPLVRTT